MPQQRSGATLDSCVSARTKRSLSRFLKTLCAHCRSISSGTGAPSNPSRTPAGHRSDAGQFRVRPRLPSEGDVRHAPVFLRTRASRDRRETTLLSRGSGGEDGRGELFMPSSVFPRLAVTLSRYWLARFSLHCARCVQIPPPVTALPSPREIHLRRRISLTNPYFFRSDGREVLPGHHQKLVITAPRGSFQWFRESLKSQLSHSLRRCSDWCFRFLSRSELVRPTCALQSG